jgi:pimeloyl-ACP methyl ester carboxylesterase
LQAPDLVRKLILLGTGPRGQGMESLPKPTKVQESPEVASRQRRRQHAANGQNCP